jgi:CheY-like chemotaxis protein
MNSLADILLIEDHYLTQDMISLLFERYNFPLHLVGNGEQALALIEQSDFKLIIIDLGLPDYEGFELIKKIKQLRPLTLCAFLGITAQADSSLIESAEQEGYLTLLEKPLTEFSQIKNQPLIEFINNLLGYKTMKENL